MHSTIKIDRAESGCSTRTEVVSSWNTWTVVYEKIRSGTRRQLEKDAQANGMAEGHVGILARGCRSRQHLNEARKQTVRTISDTMFEPSLLELRTTRDPKDSKKKIFCLAW